MSNLTSPLAQQRPQPDNLLATPVLRGANDLLPPYYGPIGTETMAGVGMQQSSSPLVGIVGGVPITKADQTGYLTTSEIVDLALGFAGPTKGWHGTPHTFAPEPAAPFGAFRDQAIGTGEGAQAYGWGHYVAGRQGIAEGYQQRLTGTTKEPGNLYHVEIAPEENELLDWDKGIREQSPEVQQKLDALYASLGHPKGRVPNAQDGETIYGYLGQMLRDKAAAEGDPRVAMGEYNASAEASAALHSAGVPGIKYLDASSRGAPQQWLLNGEEVGADAVEKSALEHLNAYDELPENEAKAAAQNLLVAKKEVGSLASKNQGPVQPVLQWLNDNMGKLTRREHPDTTRNYVIFHPSNLQIIGRNGEQLPVSLEPVDHDPFATGAP